MISQERLISLYDQYANRMYRLALSYLKNISDAEDVVQTVFTKLIEKDMTILPGKEQALLLQMTVNQCKDLLRAFWRRRTEPLEDQILFAETQDRELFQLVMALPDKYRIALYLHYYEGCTMDEIAALLRISPSAVSMRLTRGRKNAENRIGGLSMYHRIASILDKIEMDPERSEEIRNNLLASCASKATQKKPRILRKRAFVLAATLTIFLLFSGFTYGTVKYIQTVSGLQMRIRERDDGGVEVAGEYIGALNPPAEVIDGRLIFTLDGSNRDITNQCSETAYFRYDMVDEKGIQHIIIIGGTIDDWGFGDMIWDEELQTYYGHFVGDSYESPEWLRNANSALYDYNLE